METVERRMIFVFLWFLICLCRKSLYELFLLEFKLLNNICIIGATMGILCRGYVWVSIGLQKGSKLWIL